MASALPALKDGSADQQPARNRSPSEGDPVIQRRLSCEHLKHMGAARSLREIIKNLVHDTYGVTVVGLKRLSAFKDVNFLIDGTLPSLEAVEEQPSSLLANGDDGKNAAAARGGDADSGHKHAHRVHSHHRHHGHQQPVQKFLLKMLNEEESSKEAMVNLVDGQTTLARHLHARGFPTHVPMPSKSGALFEILPVPFGEFLLYHIDRTTDHESVMVTLSNSLVRLFPFLPGVPLADVPELGEHELHDVGAMLAMVHNAIVEDDFDHSAYQFWSSYLDDDDFEDGDEDVANAGNLSTHRSLSTSSSRSFKQLVKRRMSKDEANRVMPFWSFDKVAEGREAGELYVFRQKRKEILKEAFDRCEKVLLNKELLKTLPKAAVHGDFNPWNLIVDQPNSTPRTSTSSDSVSWGVAASATELAPQLLSRADAAKKSRVDSLTSPPPILTAPLTLGRYKLNGIIDFGESHYTFLIFDIAIAMSSMLDVMYSRHFQHPTTPESSAIANIKSLDFSQAAVQASAAARAAMEAAAVEPRDDDPTSAGADAAAIEHDPMFAEASRKVEKWFNCFIAGYETKRPLSQEERDAVVPLILGWEAMAIALSKKELAKQPENRYVQGFCNDQDWRRLSSFLKIFPAVEAKNGHTKRKSTSPSTPTASAATHDRPRF